jgi:hypothetical protein
MNANQPPNGNSPGRPAAAWGRPLVRLDESWTRLETILVASVLIAEIVSMCIWIGMKGMSSATTDDNAAGLVFRALFGATVLGTIAFHTTKRFTQRIMRIATTTAMLVGLFGAGTWKAAGVDYFANFLNWYQDSSSLTLIGGLRGVATQLTIWVALLGASLATASGKHINVDVVMRFLRPKFRLPVTLIGWIAAAVVCFAGVWGFFDQIAIESFGAKADSSPMEKVSQVASEQSKHVFLLRKQLGLDFQTLPHVIKGEKYDDWLYASAWNAWIKDGGWEGHFTREEVDGVLVSETPDELHSPLVVVPGGTNRSLLAHDLHLIFPFGLLVMGLRFLLRCLLAISGHVRTDIDESHDDPQAHHGPEPIAGDAPKARVAS